MLFSFHKLFNYFNLLVIMTRGVTEISGCTDRVEIWMVGSSRKTITSDE